MPGPTQTVVRPVFLDFQVTTFDLTEPKIDWFPQDVASPALRWGDPVKQIAGGTVTRCTPADTTLLGIVGAPASQGLPTSIAYTPPRTDSAGRTFVPVYLAVPQNFFRGRANTTPLQSHVTQVHDLQYVIPDASAPTPTVTPQGTTGGTTYTYKVAAVSPAGETPVGSSGTTATGNAALTTTNFNRLSIPATPNAVAFNIYKFNGSTYDYIAQVPAAASGATTFDDTGAYPALSNGSAAVNLTGWMVNLSAASTLVASVRALDTTPSVPFGAASQAVLWTIPAAKSQVQNLAGS